MDPRPLLRLSKSRSPSVADTLASPNGESHKVSQHNPTSRLYQDFFSAALDDDLQATCPIRATLYFTVGYDPSCLVLFTLINLAKNGSMQSNLFGVHVSVAGGLHNAFSAAVGLGCDCFQLFVKNQRQWRGKPLTESDIAAFKQAASATKMAPLVAHASYLLNIASPNDDIRSRSIEALSDELTRCESLGVSYLVLHPGAYLDGDLDTSLALVAQSLDDVHARCANYRSMILLETTAGQGSSVGHDFEHFRKILGKVSDPDRVGICLDTCHLFAAGHDFRSSDGYESMINQLNSAIGLALARCIHMNDSMKPCGSRVDRHDHIGKGMVGNEGFAHFVNDARFRGVPMILETPKGKDGRGADFDKLNLKRLRSLVR